MGWGVERGLEREVFMSYDHDEGLAASPVEFQVAWGFELSWGLDRQQNEIRLLPFASCVQTLTACCCVEHLSMAALGVHVAIWWGPGECLRVCVFPKRKRDPLARG